MFTFPGLKGPTDTTVIPARVLTKPEQFEKGAESRLAVYLPTEEGFWLGFVEGLRSIGIPFRITRDLKSALQHRVVILFPADSSFLKAADVTALSDFVFKGGTVIGIDAEGKSLGPLFGYDKFVENQKRLALRFVSDGPFSDPREMEVQLGPANGKKPPMKSMGYSMTSGKKFASFDDGSAAIILRHEGKGTAIAVGLDLGHLLAYGYGNRDEWVARSYSGEYEPASDVFLRLLKQWYQEGEPDAVILGTVPNGQDMSVLFTHDIDYQKSTANSIRFAELEKSEKIKGTYFIQTKYVTDFSDSGFFNLENLPAVKKLVSMGMEVGSHSVAHSLQFGDFPVGSGTETYPDYIPRRLDKSHTEGGTVLGELRVSKFLLEKLAAAKVKSFRPGHLVNPFILPEALLATGFAYSSSVTANDSLSHLPFHLTYHRSFDSFLDLIEIPVTIGDEGFKAPERLKPALELAEKLRQYGGLFNLLIHPATNVDEELAFEKTFIQTVKPYSWFGTMSEMGGWWHARGVVQADVSHKNQKIVVHLNVPEHMDGLTLHVPDRWRLNKTLGIQQKGSKVVLTKAKGAVDLTFTKDRGGS